MTDPTAETRRLAGSAGPALDLPAPALQDLLRLASAVHSSLHPEEVAARFLDQLVRLFSTSRAVLFVVDDAGRLAVKAERGPGGAAPVLPAEVVDRLLPVREGGVLSLPLHRDDRLIGAVHLERAAAFREEDQRLLEAGAVHAAQSLDHAKIHERETAFGRLLARMSEAARRLAGLGSEAEAARASIDEACRLFGCAKASLLIFDAEAGVLRVGASNCVDPALWPGIAVKPGDGLAGRVFADARPAVVDAVDQPTAGRRYSTDSYAIAPVVTKAGGRPLGVLTVTDKVSRTPFSARDEGALALFAAHAAVALEAARFFERTTADTLTRLPARSFFDARLDEEVRSAHGRAAPLALLVADIDHLKDKNEIYGTSTGDRLLRETGGVLRTFAGAPGLVARIGGEEFALMAPGLELADATALAKDLRLAVERFSFNADAEPIHATVSVGLAILKPGEAAASLLQRAEQAVYMAKKNGRNRIESAK